MIRSILVFPPQSLITLVKLPVDIRIAKTEIKEEKEIEKDWSFRKYTQTELIVVMMILWLWQEVEGREIISAIHSFSSFSMLKERVIEQLMRDTCSRNYLSRELEMVKQVTSSDCLHLETAAHFQSLFHFWSKLYGNSYCEGRTGTLVCLSSAILPSC